MITPLTAQAANWHAKQRTVVTGLLETVVYPKIHNAASFGLYDTVIRLDQFERCSPETTVQMIALLQKQGYTAKIKGKTLLIDWK